MIDWIIGIIAFIIVLGVIVLIHEGGHFFFAKKAGVLCYEYSLGMGPVIWKKKKGEVQLSLRAIPIGGYVSMAGEEIEDDPLKECKKVRLELESGRVTKIITDLDNKKYSDLPEYDLVKYDIYGTKDALEDELFVTVTNRIDESVHEETNTFIVNRNCVIVFLKDAEMQIAPYDRTMVNKTWSQRFWTIFGGPLMNFVLAWFLFVIIGLFSGYAQLNSTKIGESTGGIIKEGDEILSIDSHEVTDWNSITLVMDKYAKGEYELNNELNVKVLRDNEEVVLKVKPTIVINAIEMVLKTNEDLPVVELFNNEETMLETISGKAGIKVGDIITKIETSKGEVININSKYDLLNFFGNYERENINKEDLKMYVLRGSEELTFNLQSHGKDLLKTNNIELTKVQLGISCEYKFDILQLLYQPFVQTGDACLLIFRTFGVLFKDKSVGIKNLSGPIGILQLIKTQAEQGVLNVINWAAIISVNVGFMNILPLPALDGGRLAFLLYEGITKKKPSPKVENIIHTIGFILLMVLTVYIAFNDVIRLIFK